MDWRDEVEADFKRALELTGERWLSFLEAVALLREREPMSIGQAEAYIDDLRVAYFADGGSFGRQSGKSATVRWHWFHDTDFLTNEPNRGNTFVSEADLIHWHNRNTLAPKPAPPANNKQIDKVVKRYHQSLAAGENPSIAGLEQFADDEGLICTRQALRLADQRIFGKRRQGRPIKNN